MPCACQGVLGGQRDGGGRGRGREQADVEVTGAISFPACAPPRACRRDRTGPLRYTAVDCGCCSLPDGEPSQRQLRPPREAVDRRTLRRAALVDRQRLHPGRRRPRDLQPLRGLPRRRRAPHRGAAPLAVEATTSAGQRRQRRRPRRPARQRHRHQRRRRRRAPLRRVERARVRRRRRGRDRRPGAPRPRAAPASSGTTSSRPRAPVPAGVADLARRQDPTGLGGAGRSLVRLALDLAESRVTDWAGARVLLVGTGAYAARHLAALRDRGVDDVRVYSPSGRAATSPPARAAGRPKAATSLEAIAASDVDRHLQHRPHRRPHRSPARARRATARGRERRRLVIDLGLPRNVDPPSRRSPASSCSTSRPSACTPRSKS